MITGLKFEEHVRMALRTAVVTAVVLAGGALFGRCVLSAADDYPGPYPRPNATSVLQNERVNAWEVYWLKGQPTPMHEHKIDQLSITLRGGVVKVTTPEGKVNEGHSELGMVVFTRHGTVHQEEGTSDVPQHKIMLEIKPSTPMDPMPVSDFPPLGTKKSLENDRLIAWDFTWNSGQKVQVSQKLDSVTVFLAGGTIRSVDAKGASREIERKPGDVVYTAHSPAIFTEEALSGSPRAIIVQLK